MVNGIDQAVFEHYNQVNEMPAAGSVNSAAPSIQIAHAV